MSSYVTIGGKPVRPVSSSLGSSVPPAQSQPRHVDASLFPSTACELPDCGCGWLAVVVGSIGILALLLLVISIASHRSQSPS